MRRAEEIGSQLRALYPGSGGQKGGNGQKEGGTDEQTAHKAKGCPTEAVGKAQADRAGTAAEEPAQKGRDESDGGENQDESDELGERQGGEQVTQVQREVAIAPEGQRQTEDEAAEVEGRAEEAVQRGTHDRVHQKCGEQPVQRIEMSYQGWVRGFRAVVLDQAAERACLPRVRPERETLTILLTPGSCMVTPYMMSACSMVRLE